MKTVRARHGRWIGEISLFALFVFTSGALGGIVQPLYVGNVVPVRDEFGQPMKGSPLSQEAAGRSFVEIRTAPDGIIRPPATNGTAHPLNPMLTTSSVGGIGENAKTVDSGLFCLLFPNRPAEGTKVFARVYDAPTVEQSAFYVDSSVAVVPAAGVSLVLAFGEAQPLDPGDDDADGLNNSWERVLGTSGRAAADYDEDGMSDLHEMLAGTDAADAASLLAFQAAGPGTGEARPEGFDPAAKLLRIRWPAVPGKSYQLESAPGLLPDPATGADPVYESVGEVLTAAAGEYTMTVWVDLSEGDAKGVFRIRLAEAGAR